jgi:uracil-DNA glycosylase family protein
MTAGGGEAPDASPYLPERLNLAALREAVDGCRGCRLYERATQAVFGEGRKRSRLMLVGEQPGDQEDREGRPFVGPAGRLLGEMLEEAGIDRGEAYVTNAVKHFKWKEGRGKRRIHDKPAPMEIRACRPWLEAELEVVAPEIVVCLGATAAQALLGSGVRIGRDRGSFFEAEEAGLKGEAMRLTVTMHPSAILRQREQEDRRRERAAVVKDLQAVAAQL